MIKKELIPYVSPKAFAENTVFFKDYRITVLSPGLFRIEKSPSLTFRDEATLSVWFRDMPLQKFSVKRTDKQCEITTERASLIIKEKRKDCRARIEGKELPISNSGNLGGTYRTLDNCDGDFEVYEWVGPDAVPVNKRIKLGNGVCSLTGVAVIDDSETLSLGEDGQVKERSASGTDEYVFCYGDDYRGAVRALYSLCGMPPVLPKFAFGNWWSRYHAYTDKEYLGVLNGFEENELPFTVATIDMDWHYSTDVAERFHTKESGFDDEYHGGDSGWTGYTWNKDLFPDYKAFLSQLKKKNYAVTLNLHPALGVRWWEESYEEMAKAVGADYENKQAVNFDITDEKFINAYFDILHKPYEKDGVDFWWIDWQQGQKCKIKGLDPLWSLNHYHFMDISADKPSLILSRYAGVGSHRYPVGFTGDTYMSWKTLAYLPYFTATATNIGYTWWSHDIGGHQKGVKDDELYARFIQYGVFSPINRLHCMDAETVTKEPTYYGAAGLVAEEFLRFRHKLIPFIYSRSIETAKYGNALIEPLYYEYKDKECYNYPNEYIFGGTLIVAPVTEKTKRDGYARVKAYLPKGKWTDIFTGDEYNVSSGKEVQLLRDITSIPVFAKAGSVLPLSADKGNGTGAPQKLELNVFSGNGEYGFYEENDTLTKVRLSENEEGEDIVQTVIINEKTRIEVKREYFIKFCNICEETARITVNGKSVAAYPYDKCLAVKVKRKKRLEIKVRYKKEEPLCRLLTVAARIITKYRGDNEKKFGLYERLKKAVSVAEFTVIINSLEDGLLKNLLEEVIL